MRDNKIKRRIAHISDVHIPNDINKHIIHKCVFEELYKSLRYYSPDVIVVAGDTLDNFIETSLEAEHLASEFLNKLSEIANVVHTIGNHEIRKSDLKRFSSIGTVINIMNNDKISLYDKSGFFEYDDYITFVNYSHLEKKIHPWRDISHNKNNDKFYIGLYHDVIYGCQYYSGITEEGKDRIKIDTFDNNDINMFGDIHKRQFFNDKSAYCGSLIQNNFGEDIEEHGYLIWDIYDNDEIKCTEVNIKNDYTYITFNINEGFDYDNIQFGNEHATEKSFFRFVWSDIYHNFNNENHRKLESYIHNKWNKNQIDYKKTKIFKSFDSVIEIEDNRNIEDTDYQHELFRTYLESNKIDEETIQQILILDSVVNNLMEKHDSISGIVWNIDKFWADNFKSYDKIEIDWTDVHGIIKLMGENQMGKSNLLDLISYICFGTTLYTNKVGGATREKFTDNRYINNKKNLDYCNGGAVIDINGQKYTIIRSTLREYTKNRGSIKSCQTKLEYYRGTEISEDNKEVGESKIKTQKLIEQVLGEFSDFIRISLTTADNLSSLISIERSVFLDSLIRDAGHDIFERKLDVFKKYKKSIEETRIKLDINKEKTDIKRIEEEINILDKEKNDISINICEKEISIENKNNEKNVLLQSKNVIDSDICDFELEPSLVLIESYKSEIGVLGISIDTNNNEINVLPTSFDNDEIIKKNQEIHTIGTSIYDIKTQINNISNSVAILNNKIATNTKTEENIISNFKTNIENEINSKKRDISDINKQIEQTINDEKRNISDGIKNYNYEISNLQKDYDILVSDGMKLKTVITEIESDITVMKSSERCVVCGNLYKNDKDALEHQNNKIKELVDKCSIKNAEIEIIRNNARGIKEKLNDITKNKLEKLKIDLNNIETGLYNDGFKIILKSFEDIKSNIIVDISKLEISRNDIQNVANNNSDILKLREDSKISLKQIEDNGILKIKFENDILLFEILLTKLKSELVLLEKVKSDSERRKALIDENREKQLIIDNKELLIGILENKIIKYNNNIVYINFNKDIDTNVKLLDDELSLLKFELSEFNKAYNKNVQYITIKSNSIDIINNNIIIFEKQVKQDELYKLYTQSIDRGGIPSMLIMKSRDMINKYISDMLCDCNFNVFLDEELELQLTSDVSTGINQNLLTSCGKEKTFGVMALRFALREINNKSKCNICIMDEVCGKLDKKSIKDFNEMLKSASKRIDKIIVIEHNVDIDFDIAYLANKDKNGISSLQLV